MSNNIYVISGKKNNFKAFYGDSEELRPKGRKL